LHPHPYSSKFPSLTLQGGQQFGASLANDGSDSAGVGSKLQLSVSLLCNANPQGEWTRQVPADGLRERHFTIAARGPAGQRRVGTQDALKRLRGTRHGGMGPLLDSGGSTRRKNWEEPH
jgi:hypothetical protein